MKRAQAVPREKHAVAHRKTPRIFLFLLFCGLVLCLGTIGCSSTSKGKKVDWTPWSKKEQQVQQKTPGTPKTMDEFMGMRRNDAWRY